MARNSSLLNSLRASSDSTARKAAEAIEGVSQDLDALRLTVGKLQASIPTPVINLSKLTLSVDGRLLIENDACPRSPFTAVTKIARIALTLKSASVGGGVTVALKRITTAWISATIPAGTTYYEIPVATVLAALPILANEWVRVDVSSVPSGAGTFPGSDLSVTLFF